MRSVSLTTSMVKKNQPVPYRYISVHPNMSVEEVKTMLLGNVSINNSEFDPGYFLGQDLCENETWEIGDLDQTDTSTIHIYSRDSDGKVQIRTLSEKALSLDIGNAAMYRGQWV